MKIEIPMYFACGLCPTPNEKLKINSFSDEERDRIWNEMQIHFETVHGRKHAHDAICLRTRHKNHE